MVTTSADEPGLMSEDADRWLALLERGDREALALHIDAFDHRAHLLVGWRLATTLPPTRAIERMSAALRRATQVLGVEGKYHETLTWAWMLIILERIDVPPSASSFTAFLKQNPDLEDARDCLSQYYESSIFDDPTARHRFMLPRRVA